MNCPLLLNENTFHEVSKYISLCDMLRLRLVCKQADHQFKKEIRDGWIVKSLRKYFTSFVPYLDFDHILKEVRNGEYILIGTIFKYWFYLEELNTYTLSVCSISKYETSVFGKRMPEVSKDDRYNVEHLCRTYFFQDGNTTNEISCHQHQSRPIVKGGRIPTTLKIRRTDIARQIVIYEMSEILILFDGYSLWCAGSSFRPAKKNKRSIKHTL